MVEAELTCYAQTSCLTFSLLHELLIAIILLQAAGVRESLDKVITERFSELAQQGVHSVSEVCIYLELFMQYDLFKGCTLPDKTSRKFYSANKGICNHLYKGKPNHFSTID